jgi:hypothetical protein
MSEPLYSGLHANCTQVGSDVHLNSPQRGNHMLARGSAPGDQKNKNTCALKGPNMVSDLVRWITFFASD